MNTPKTDLDWLAFRFVAGEMASAEQLEFETRLLDDQIAREAVAAAVELTWAIQRASSLPCVETHMESAPSDNRPNRDSSRIPTRRLAWLGLGAAACLAVAFFVGREITPAPAPGDSNAHPPADQLAIVWSQTRQAPEPSESDDDATLSEDETVVSEGILTPSWVVAAVIQQEESRQALNPNDLNEL